MSDQSKRSPSADQYFESEYTEIHRLASRRLRSERVDSLQTTDLVHEAYLKLNGAAKPWVGDSHFFAAAAESMRRILVDRARRRKAVKQGGERQRVDLQDTALGWSDLQCLRPLDCAGGQQLRNSHGGLSEFRYFGARQRIRRFDSKSVGSAKSCWN